MLGSFSEFSSKGKREEDEMSAYRDFLRYTMISLIALGAMIAFWYILVTYLERSPWFSTDMRASSSLRCSSS